VHIDCFVKGANLVARPAGGLDLQVADAFRYLEIPPQAPPAPAAAATPAVRAPAGAASASATGGAAPPGTVAVPDVRGMSMRAAASCLEKAGLRLVALGTGRAVKQEPAPGAALPPGGVVRVEFAPPPDLPP